jgi:hypothetical protein
MNRPLPNYVVLKDLGGCQGHQFVIPRRELICALLSGLPDLGQFHLGGVPILEGADYHLDRSSGFGVTII